MVKQPKVSNKYFKDKAFFSATDVKDSVGTKLYGVIGKIDKEVPEVYLTAGANGQHIRLKAEDVFDFSVEKLHETSDYTIDPLLIANITERKYAAPVYNGYNYPKNTSKPIAPKTTVGHSTYGSTYNNSKTKLINAVHTYVSTYSLSPFKLQDICTAFMDFLEDEAFSKDVIYAKDLEKMAEITENLGVQFAILLEDLLKNYGLEPKEEVDVETTLQHTQSTDDDAVNNYALHSYTPNHLY